MTKPLFASKWFKDVPATELRQEIQNLYRETARLEGEKLEPGDLGPIEDSIADLKAAIDGIVGEIGSNENGSWVRFGNGLQVCWFQSDTQVPTNGQTVAPWWHTDVTVFVYPQQFAEVPTIIPTSRTASNGLGVTVTGASSGSCSMRGWGVNNGQWVRFGYVAIGRWK